MTGSILPPPLAVASQMRRTGSDSDSDSVSLPSSLGHRSLDRRNHRSGTGTGTATPGSTSGAGGTTLPRPTSRGPHHGKGTPTGPPGGVLGWGSSSISRAIPVPIPLPPSHAHPDAAMMGSLPLGAGSLPRTSALGTLGSGKHRWMSHNGRPSEGISRFRGPDLDQEAQDAALNDSQEGLESGLQTQLTMMNMGVGGGGGSEDMLLGGPSPMLPLMTLGPMVLHSVHSSQDVQVPVPVCPALCEIRSQLQELTRSVETCQSEVSEMKRDMAAIRHDVETVHQVKEEIEELRECVDRLEEQSRRRKLRLLEQGLTCFLSYAIFAAVLGMLQFGYNTGVINAPQSIIEQFIQEAYYTRYGITMEEKTAKIVFSIAVAMFAVGGMIGGFIGGFVANRYGRKRGLLLNNIAGVLGACFMGFSKYPNSYEMLIIGRLLIGFNCGLNTSLVPMYISEIAPLTLRGGLGTVNQLGVTVGMLISQVLGIEQVLGTKDGWPLLLGLAVVPSLLQLILFSVCPESPRYLLITQNREDEARKALRRLRACSQIEEDVEEMRAEERAQEAEARISMKELILSRNLRKPLVIGVVMQLSQQLSGINAVFYYSTTLFKSAGLGDDAAKYATIGIGAIMVVMTLISIPLMDKAGRRTLHLWGLGGMFIFSIFITISLLVKDLIEWVSYVAVVATLSFVVFFAVGPGSIPWMITAELFSQGPRPAAMSIAVLVNWTANFVVGFGFPSMQVGLENYTFLPFSVLLAIFWVFTYKKVPETRNKTFEEISALFRKSDRNSTNCISSLGSSVGVAMPIPAHENTALLSEDKSLGFPTRDLRKLVQ